MSGHEIADGPAFHAPNDRVETRRIASALTQTGFVLRGGRYHLFLLESGSGILAAEDGEHRLTPPTIYWLPDGMVRTITVSAGSTGILVSIPDALLGQAIPQDILGSQVRRIIGMRQHLQQVAPESFQTMQSHAQLAERELAANGPGMETVLQNSVSIILIELWRLSGAEVVQPVPLPRNLVHTFVSLLDVHLRDHWSVADYASHMGVSRDRLTSVLRRATGESPLSLIHKKMIAEAKVLLTSTNQQVAEVAFTLGFNDPAYFSRFFQRHIGMTPARFRRDKRRPESEDAESFAAWP